MSIQLIKKGQQAQGAFDFGRIQENKPVGFPHEKGEIQSYSNLFYWAHAWSDEGGLIDTHPHQGFEIMSYVIDGEISHFDTKNNAWLELSKGDAQLIKSGSGISHAEKIHAGARIFQIWFDPNIAKTINIPAGYADVKSARFPVEHTGGVAIKTIVGEGSPLQLDAEAIEIKAYSTDLDSLPLNMDGLSTYALYVIDGAGSLGEIHWEANDLLTLKGEQSVLLALSGPSKFFVIKTPSKVSYPTYVEMQKG